MPSTRPAFKTRSIRLAGEVQLATAEAALRNVPLDPERPIECLLREIPKGRGIDQNGLYWLRLGEIADQAWQGGRQYNSDVWHE